MVAEHLHAGLSVGVEGGLEAQLGDPWRRRRAEGEQREAPGWKPRQRGYGVMLRSLAVGGGELHLHTDAELQKYKCTIIMIDYK